MVSKKDIVDAAQKVLEDLGPYYTERVYEEALMHEFKCCEIPYERQRNIEIIYKGYTVGTRTPDCILNPPWSKQEEEEFLVEMKALASIGSTQEKQVRVYLASMNIDQGAVLNFNKNKGKIESIEVQNPGREFRKDVVFPNGTCDEVNEEILKKAGEEVIDYFGTEFFYDSSGLELYKKAIGVELRLQGLRFCSITYPVLYEHHHVSDYSYDFVFCNGEATKIFAYKEDDEIDSQVKEFEAFSKRFSKAGFDIKEGFVLALPKEEERVKKEEKKEKEKIGVVVKKVQLAN